MGFALPKDASDTATQLRELEPQAPKHMKAVMIQAANELEDWKRLAQDAAHRLEEAANLHISQMATTSAIEDVYRQIRLTMIDLAARFRVLL